MSTSWRPNGHNFAPEYQVSSWPFVTSSNVATPADTINIQFPGVTRWICIHNNENSGGSKTLKIAFTENGLSSAAGNHYLLHAGEQTQRWEVKCKEIFISAQHSDINFSVMAGYTGVLTGSFPTITASNGFEGVG